MNTESIAKILYENPMKLTSFRLPTALHDRIKVYVAKEGMTVQGFMRKAIELYLMKLSTRTHALPGQAHMCTCIPDENGQCTCPIPTPRYETCICDNAPCQCDDKNK